MSANKYEALIELIINEEQDKARSLFHDIVVEQSRKIYEGLIEADDEGMDDFGGNEVEDFADDVSADEEGLDDGDEFGGEEEFGGDEGSIDDRVMDLESAIDELQAEFDQLMADEAGEEGHDDLGGDSDFDADDDVEGGEFEGDDDMEESMVREYVEKVAATSNTEGAPIGSGGKSVSVNTKSTVAGKNDMGGSSKNIAKGGSESAPDGTPATKKPANAYTKGQGTLIGKVENSPGANTKGYSTKRSAK